MADPASHLPLRPKVFHVLLTLSGGAQHGYGLKKSILDRTAGTIDLDPGGLYRLVARLEEDGWIEPAPPPHGTADDPRRRYYQLTELGVEVVPVDSATAALKDADIVTTITTSPTPVFAGNQLDKAKAVHINALGAHYPWVREVDEDVVLNSRVIVDEWEQGLREQGELLIPMEQKRIDTSHVAGDLGAVVSGQVTGRGPNDRWTLFLSGGTGIEDVAVATKLYEAARAQGVGTTFEFNQPYEFEL